ncbi:MAG: tail fiber domain-containing protein [Candidatus Buchananbacteria bacterium]
MTVNGVTSTASLNVSGISSLATTSMSYGSTIGNSNSYWSFGSTNIPNFGPLAMLNPVSMNQSLGGIYKGLYVVGQDDDAPQLGLMDINFNNKFLINYATSTHGVTFAGQNDLGLGIPEMTYTFSGNGLIVNSGDSNSLLTLQNNSLSSSLSLSSSTSVLSATGASGYSFDNKLSIGTSTQNYLLTVDGTSYFAATSTMKNIVPASSLSYDLGNSSSKWNKGWFNTLNIGTSTWSMIQSANSRLSIFDLSNGLGNERLTVLTNGNVGIGTSSPGAVLSVAGDTYVSGNLTATGTATILGDLAVTGGITLGGEYRTTWPSGGGGGGSWWATSSDDLVGYSNLAGNYAIVLGSAVTSSNVKFEVVGASKLGGATTITGALSVSNNIIASSGYVSSSGGFFTSSSNSALGGLTISSGGGLTLSGTTITSWTELSGGNFWGYTSSSGSFDIGYSPAGYKIVIGNTTTTLVNTTFEVAGDSYLNGNTTTTGRLHVGTSTDYIDLGLASFTGGNMAMIKATSTIGGNELGIYNGLKIVSESNAANNSRLTFFNDDLSASSTINYNVNNDTLDFNNASSYYFDSNVGINNSSPSYTLDVNGSVRASSSLQVGGETTTAQTLAHIKNSYSGLADAYGLMVDRYQKTSATSTASLYGLYARAGVNNLNMGVTLGNAYGIYSTVYGDGNGLIQNAFSLFLDSPTGSVTNGYNIYASGTAPNYLGGSLSVGTTTKTAALNVSTSGPAALIGYNNSFSGTSNGAVAMGYSSNVSGNGSFAMGYYTSVIGDGSVALGYKNSVINTVVGATALGYQNISGGAGAFAAGRLNVASGASSIALGQNITVTGANSMGIGLSTISNTVTSTNSLVSQDNVLAIMGGNVGIGTTSPAYKLSVIGDIDVSAGYTYKLNGVSMITASTTLNNYFFGGAGNLTMTGIQNTATGYQSLSSNTTGTYNTANGYQSLYTNSTGYENTASGYQSLNKNTTGYYNTANGYSALYSNTGGHENAAYGWSSLYFNDSGNNNTAFGLNSLHENRYGSNNTGIGYRAGYYVLGSGNVTLGYYAGSYETSSNSFYVDNQNRTNTAGDKAGALLYGTFNATPASQTLKINASTTVAQNLSVLGTGSNYFSGTMLIGTTTPYSATTSLTVAGSLYADHIYTSGNSFYMNGVKIIGSNATDLNFYADTSQNLKLTAINGQLQLFSTGAGGGININSSSSLSVVGNAATVQGNESLMLKTIGDSHNLTVQTNGNGSSIGISASGINSNVNLSATQAITLTAPLINITGSFSNMTSTGYLLVGSAPTGANYSTGYLNVQNGGIFGGNLAVAGNATTTGNQVIGGTLTVTGTLDPNGAITLPTTGITGAGTGSGLDADLLDGAQPSMVAGNSTIVQRNASGYVFANYFNTTAGATATAASHFAIQTGSDNYIRWQTPANAKISLGLDGVDNTADSAKNVLSATKLTTARAINGVNFDGSAAISIGDLRGSNYVSTGAEKPNNAVFGSGKFRYQMLSGANLGSGAASWNDVLWTSSYTGTDVKGSNALIFGKTSDFIGFARQDYDSAAWGTINTIYHTGNKPTATDVGLGNVNNTSDANKPVSTAQQTALDLKANLAGPTFTGTVTIPTPFTLGSISMTANASELNILDNTTVTATELNYVHGVTSAIQTQLGTKQGTLTNSLGLKNALSDETGSGAAMFGTSPTITTSLLMENGAYIGQAAGPQLVFDDTNNYFEMTGGNVGIGTTTPAEKLYIEGDSSSGNIRALIRNMNPASFGGFNLGNDASSNAAGIFLAGSSVSSYGGANSMGIMTFIDSPLVLGANNSIKMTILSSGNVGIGTSTPSNKLDIISDNNTDVGGVIRIKSNNLTSSSTYGFKGIRSTDDFTIQTGYGKSIVLNPSGGNVGIGTSSPTALLHIVGSDSTGGDGVMPIVENTASGNSFAGMTFKTSGAKAGAVYGGVGNPLYGIVDGLTLDAGNGSRDIGFRVGTAAFTNPGTATGPGMIIKASGFVGIGTSTPAYTLDVVGASTNVARFRNNALGTTCTLTSATGIIACSSDERLKTNINAVANALGTIRQLKPVTFDWIKGDSTTPLQYGFIAQDVKKILPDMVSTGDDGYLSLSMTEILPVLTGAIKDLDVQVANQQTQLDLLTSRVDNLTMSNTSTSSESLTVIDNNINTSNLSVIQSATFYGTITVIGEANFQSKTYFHDQTYFSKDSAGKATILQNATSTHITYSRPYGVSPIITITPTSDSVDYRYWVTNETPAGFDIAINANALNDIIFNWHAVAVIEDDTEEVQNQIIEAVIPPEETTTLTPEQSSTTEPVINTTTTTSTIEIINNEATTAEPVINTTTTTDSNI